MNTEITSEKIIELLKKYRIILICIGSVLASFLILALIVVPQVLAYFSTQDQIKDLQKKSQDLQKQLSVLQNTDPNTVKQGLSAVTTVLPDNPEIPDAMVAIQEKALSSNLKVDAISFLSNNTQSKSSSFGVEIRVSGPLVNLRAFLINLSTVPRIAEVETITMQKKDENVEATIPIQVYYRNSSPVTSDGSVTLTEEQQKLLTQISKLVPTSTSELPATIDTSNIQLGKPDPFE